MKFSLNNFETYVSSTIVNRGRQYWKKGNVEEVTETAPGEWFAIVEGSERYEVEIKIGVSGEINDYSCDCPYDGGDVCKHIVAVLFELKNEAAASDKKPSSEMKTAAGKKDAIDEILSQITPEELRPWLTKALLKNADLKAEFLSQFGALTSEGPAGQYKSILTAMIHSYSYKGKSKGFMEYRESMQFGQAVSKMIADAERNSSKQQHGLINYVALCMEVVRQLCENYGGADDSSGDYSGALNQAFEGLVNVASDDRTADYLIDDIRQFARDAFHAENIAAFDSERRLPAIMIAAIRTEAHVDELILNFKAAIDAVLEKGEKSNNKWSDNYDLERLVQYVIELLDRINRKDEAAAFEGKFIYLSKFREKAIQKAFKAKDYDRVRSLALEGIQTNEQYPGLVQKWRNWLLEIQKAGGMPAELVRKLESTFLETKEMKDYRDLKELIPKGDFSKKVGDWIAHFKKQNDYDLVVKLYVDNKLWEELMIFAEKNPDFDLPMIVGIREHVQFNYRERYGELFEKAFFNEIVDVRTAAAFKKACSFLPQLKYYIGRARYEALLARLKKDFAQRDTLLKVLEKVKSY